MKKRLIYTLIIGLVVSVVKGQTASTSHNYITTETVLVENKTTESEVDALNYTGKSTSIQYFDGLGRPELVIQHKAAPGGIKDIATPVVYDEFGREAKKYLPYAKTTSNGAYFSGAESGQASYYSGKYGGDSAYPYSETVFENSPLNRVLEQGAPGYDWQPSASGGGHTVKTEYGTNGQYDVLIFEVEDDQMENTGGESDGILYYYGAGQLYKTIMKDENWTSSSQKLHTTEEYKDKLGQVVLKRSYVGIAGSETAVETYYVYDDYGLLRFVVPPKAVDNLLNPESDYSDDASAVWVTSDATLSEAESGVGTYLVDDEASLTLEHGFTFAATSTSTLSISTVSLSGDLMYSYKYDGRKRMIEKKIPGAEPVYMVYDARDRLVATQDGNMRDPNKDGDYSDAQWLFTKYDVFNRPVMTGFLENGIATQEGMQGEINTFYPTDANGHVTVDMFESIGGTVHGYTNNTFPEVDGEDDYLTVTYYDDYTWMKTEGGEDADEWGYFTNLYNLFSSHGLTGATVPAMSVNQKVKGQVTGSKTRVLEDGNTWLTNTIYYDNHYRPILTLSKNYLGGEDIVLTKYDFLGKVMETWQRQTNNIDAITERFIRQVNSYDHAGRLLETQQQMTGATNLVTLTTNTYNELGELTTKYVGGVDELSSAQVVDYKYNIRGWLTGINNVDAGASGKRKFALRLSYKDVPYGLHTTLHEGGQYNGNIAAMEWVTPASSDLSYDGSVQGYGFTYDALNRLTDAKYGMYSLVGKMYRQDYYNYGVHNLQYDLNGNILGLSRIQMANQVGGQIDDLTYKYIGNQLLSVNDLATGDVEHGFYDNDKGIDYVDYDYDLNGNMTSNANKGLSSVEYNYLNLPKLLTSNNNETIEYIYDANGQKLMKVSTTGMETYYSGSFVYEDSSLKYILNSEGKYDLSSGTGQYQFNLKDHLGNVRMVVDVDGNEIQQSAYYPFGMTYMATNSIVNKYLYNSKELQDDAIGNRHLDWYDYGARMYDPAIARFSSIDPLANSYRSFSAYHYALNNPIRFIDFQGMGAQEKGKKEAKKKEVPKGVKVEGFTPRYSGSPLSITGTLKGKVWGGKFGIKSGNRELLLSGNIVSGSISGTVSDENQTKGTLTFLTGEAKAKYGDTGLELKASGYQAEAAINEDGEITTKQSALTGEGKLGYDGKGASVSKSVWTSDGSDDSKVEFVGGDNKVDSGDGKTTFTAGASVAEVSVTVDHNNAGNFLYDLFNLIGLAVFGDLDQNKQIGDGK